MKSHLSQISAIVPAKPISFIGLCLCIVFFSAIFNIVAAATPPSNDHFTGAQLLVGVDGTVTGSNIGATKEPGEPVHAGNRGGASIWYKYVATSNSVVKLKVVGGDPILAVYRGSSVVDLVPIAANDNTVYQSFFGTYSTVVFGSQAGATYYIAVDGAYDAATGATVTSSKELIYQTDMTPTTDSFGAAAGVTSALSENSGTIPLTFTNVGATKEAGEPNHAGNVGGKSVWFSLKTTGPNVMSFTFTLESKSLSSPASGIPSLFAIYTGSSLSTLTPLISTITASGRVARLTLLIQPNTPYYIAIDSQDASPVTAPGNFTLT